MLAFRPAEPGDAEFLSVLLGELGYPTPAEEVPDRLAAIAEVSKSLALVATIEDEVVGLITIIIFPAIHQKLPGSLITSLVVSSKYRGKGIGSELVSRAEKWAAENGAARVTVGSGLRRKETHQFYLNRQYDHSGMRFTKSLSANG